MYIINRLTCDFLLPYFVPKSFRPADLPLPLEFYADATKKLETELIASAGHNRLVLDRVRGRLSLKRFYIIISRERAADSYRCTRRRNAYRRRRRRDGLKTSSRRIRRKKITLRQWAPESTIDSF